MTEAEWEDSSHADAMLEAIQPQVRLTSMPKDAHELSAMLDAARAKVSDRKLRLFACACCRSVWNQITAKRSRKAVETAERYAENLASADDLSRARNLALDAARDVQPPDTRDLPKFNPRMTTEEARRRMAAESADTRMNISILARCARFGGFGGPVLLRDIIGNPFRPVTADSSWLTSTVTALARQMYESRDFSPMPILADALQDAGCDHPDILAHCRSDGPHVRGCWVVDLVLGRS